MGEASSQAGLARETRRFGTNAILYLVPSLLLRGASFLLTPLYTAAMGPGDFAIIAVANSLTAVLGIALGMSLPACIPRLFFECEPREQRSFFGTLLVISLVVPAAIVALLYAVGAAGHLDVFESVRFSPHIKLVLFTSLLNVYLPLPAGVYMAREEPRKVALLSALAGLSQLGLSVVFVAGLHQGALGVLRANLVSSALVGVTSIVLMLRMSNFAWPLPRLGQALVFSLPLVPHLTANWALAISDRLVLDRYVPAADVGRYSLGYVFSLIVSLVAASIGNALGPAANRQLKDPLLAPNVPPLGTYSLVATVAFALGVAVTAPEILAIVAPASYAPASAVVPWVVLGAVFQGFYFVWSTGTWFSMKTKLVPLVTLASAALNVGLNLVFVPRYGVMAAAVSTAVSYAASAALHGLLAQHLHPIAWEYRRWALLLGVGAICYGAGMALPQPGVLASLAIKTVFVALAFPLGLIATGFLTRSEAAGARARLARGLRRV